MRRTTAPARQRGMSLLGFLFVAAVLIVIAMLAFRVTPAVIEYYSVKRALGEALREAKDPSAPNDVRRAFQKQADAGYIESVRGNDVEISKQGNEITASVGWTRTLHLVANASLLLEFEASATR
jgi:hypothetical protein